MEAYHYWLIAVGALSLVLVVLILQVLRVF